MTGDAFKVALRRQIDKDRELAALLKLACRRLRGQWKKSA